MNKKFVPFFLAALAFSAMALPMTEWTDLHEAAKLGNADVLRRLLKDDIDANLPLLNGATALHVAAGHHNVECISILIEYGANVNAARDDGMTPLHFAALSGKFACVKILIRNGAKIYAQTTRHKITPVMLAARNGYRGIVHYLTTTTNELS